MKRQYQVLREFPSPCYTSSLGIEKPQIIWDGISNLEHYLSQEGKQRKGMGIDEEFYHRADARYD
ncbi:MAG: hypothetical protein HYX24_03965 [Candidatus Aenigmarchaeota archaeon]|nr:hypothetical protein [Candidatus Aenigmarchaeota archaeon]